MFFVRGLGAVSMFLLYAVAARRLPIDQAGHFFIGLASVTMLVPIASFGLQIISLRLISARSLKENADEIRFVVRKSLLSAMLSSVVIAFLSHQLAPWIATHIFSKPDLADVMRWVSPAIVFGCLAMVISHHLQGIRYFSASLFVLSIATPLLTAVAMLCLPQMTATTSAQVLSAASLGACLIGLLLWRLACPAGAVKRVEISGLLRSCLALWTVNTMIVIVNWSGQVVAGAFADAADVAVLSVAQRTANLVNFILIGVNFVVTPRFARLWAQRDHSGLRDLALKSTAAMSLAAVPIVVGILTFPEQIMGLFGPVFRSGAPLLVILALGQLFNVMTGSVNALLCMCGFEHDLRNIVISSSLLAVVMSVVLTKQFGVTGTAVATATALAIQNVYAIAIVKKRLGFSMFGAVSVLPRMIRQPN